MALQQVFEYLRYAGKPDLSGLDTPELTKGNSKLLKRHEDIL
jgi:hypothetical protein